MRVGSKLVFFGAAVALVLAVQLCCGTGHSVISSHGSHSVNLAWNASSGTIAGYNIYRGSQSGGPYGKLNSQVQAASQFTDTNVQAGLTYYYVVTAVNTNSIESNYSNEAAATIPEP